MVNETANSNGPIPSEVPNWVQGEETPASTNLWIEKKNPATGKLLCKLARSNEQDVERAVSGAATAQRAWAETPGVKRGDVLQRVVTEMRNSREELATIVALEAGKSLKHALGETDGAIQLASFYAGEGQRLYGRTTTSGMLHRSAMTLRCPIGVAGLIMAANTPIANVAWKLFPALICGNAAVVKPPEDAPATAWAVARCAKRAGLPPGLFQIVQGLGDEAGGPLVAHPSVGVVSFTDSTNVGRRIAKVVADRVGRVSLELGGKNALVVCDDADLTNAVEWAVQSAFSNAGQRCAAGSRLVVFSSVYEAFRERLLARIQTLKVGTSDQDDFGPVINERQLTNMMKAVETAKSQGARVIAGGHRLTGSGYDGGYYMAPTLIENVSPQVEISTHELFGPITCLYRVDDYAQALSMVNDSPYGLTACIHTKNLHRAWHFVERVQTGVAFVNAGTFGSEPHMPFGGTKLSGNGTREPGTEALDIYSSLKDVYLSIDPSQL